MQNGSVSQQHDDCLSIYLNTGKYTFQALVSDGSEGAKESAVLSAGPRGELTVAQ